MQADFDPFAVMSISCTTALQKRIGQTVILHGDHLVNKLLNLFMNSHIIVRLRAICGLGVCAVEISVARKWHNEDSFSVF